MKKGLLDTRKLIYHFIIEKNNFIQKIVLPDNYWSYTISMSNLEKANNNNQLKLEYQEKVNDNEKLLRTKQLKSIPSFVRPREDWDISHGDFIVNEKKEIKRKFFTQQDWKNFKNSFWYFLLSILIVYYTLQFVSKLS